MIQGALKRHSKLARMVMVSALRRVRPDWELIEASNAAEALEAISTRAVDVTFVDFNMPGTDGLELVALVRKTHPRMPVAVVSANIQTEIISRTRELDASFVAKPLTERSTCGIFVRRCVTSQERGQMTTDAGALSEIEQDVIAEIANIWE